jgi:hypothetical protein
MGISAVAPTKLSSCACSKDSQDIVQYCGKDPRYLICFRLGSIRLQGVEWEQESLPFYMSYSG